MMPPYLDKANLVKPLLDNMEYAGVSAAVVTQEYIDGNQDEYLLEVKRCYPMQFRICSLYRGQTEADLRFDGIKVPAQRLENPELKVLMPLIYDLEKKGMFYPLICWKVSGKLAAWKKLFRNAPICGSLLDILAWWDGGIGKSRSN